MVVVGKQKVARVVALFFQNSVLLCLYISFMIFCINFHAFVCVRLLIWRRVSFTFKVCLQQPAGSFTDLLHYCVRFISIIYVARENWEYTRTIAHLLKGTLFAWTRRRTTTTKWWFELKISSSCVTTQGGPPSGIFCFFFRPGLTLLTSIALSVYTKITARLITFISL